MHGDGPVDAVGEDLEDLGVVAEEQHDGVREHQVDEADPAVVEGRPGLRRSFRRIGQALHRDGLAVVPAEGVGDQQAVGREQVDGVLMQVGDVVPLGEGVDGEFPVGRDVVDAPSVEVQAAKVPARELGVEGPEVGVEIERLAVRGREHPQHA